ncbi:MAG: insulinase family protein [Holosporaceae bacterium]|jgi:predicted Zn-dependent peptidase|nr:insulinase family protein [Holosporaceae bacterium]
MIYHRPFGKFAIVFAIFSLFLSCSAENYRGCSVHKTDGGVTVIFADTPKPDGLLVMLCISSGSTDEIEKTGVSNLLNRIFEQKLKQNTGSDLQYGSESNSYAGYDHSIYYFYGKTENLAGFIKNLGTTFSNFTFTSDEMDGCKRMIEKKIIEDRQTDKNFIRYESRKSLYWHSRYGSPIYGNEDDLKSISEEDVKNFKNKNYVNGRTTLIIAGKVDKKFALEEIEKYFKKSDIPEEPINRLQEPPHHGSSVKLTKYSSQVSVPIIEMYWKIPDYRNQKEKARAAEIFINCLDEILQKNLIEKQKAVASVSFTYSFWNYDYGDFCITITAGNSDTDDVIRAVLTEIKYAASEGISEAQAKKAAKKLTASADVFRYEVDVLDWTDWISKKTGSRNDFDFLKSYCNFINKFDLKEVNAQAKEIFKNDPCVISILKPEVKRKAV